MLEIGQSSCKPQQVVGNFQTFPDSMTNWTVGEVKRDVQLALVQAIRASGALILPCRQAVCPVCTVHVDTNVSAAALEMHGKCTQ